MHVMYNSEQMRLLKQKHIVQ